MALIAGGREARLHMVGIGGPVVILDMTGGASAAGEVVVSIHVALDALQVDVSSSQSKSGGVVIEGRVRPRGCVVALLTGGGEFRLHVIRVGRPVVILHVAGGARGAGQVVVAIYVTLGALQVGVSGSQRKSNGVVVETRRRPRAGAVAGLTSLREVRLHMVRVGRALEILQVTAHAVCRRAFELIIDVACGAIQGGMHTGKSKSGVLKVIEADPEPVVHPMTLVAARGESSGDVSGSGGSLKIFRVTRVALSRQPLILAAGSAFVARLAVESCVSSQ